MGRIEKKERKEGARERRMEEEKEKGQRREERRMKDESVCG